MDIREFKDIYGEFYPSVVWDWCAKPTPEEIDMQLEKFSDCGISTVYIRPAKGLVTPYLSDDYLELIRTAARRGARYGVSLFICDENSSASGNGGREITSVADYRIRDFVKASGKDVEKTDEVLSDNIVLRDISSMRASKRIPLADITDSFVTECFIDEVYNKYIRGCKRFIGYEIKGFATNINIPEDSLPCSPTTIKELGSSTLECGKSLIKGDKEFKKDYYNNFSKCIEKNFTSSVHSKCVENELLLSVSVCGKDEISRQKQYINSDIVTFETDSPIKNFLQFKLAESISAQFEKPFTVRLMSERFSPCSERFNLAASVLAMGAENICYDSVAFSLSDRRKYENNTIVLSEFSEKDMSGRIARFSKVCSQTDSSAKVLVICSLHNAKFFEELCGHLLNSGVDFHIVEEEFFTAYARISPEFINIGKFNYDTIICHKDFSFESDSFEGRRIALDTNISAKNCTVTCEYGCDISADKEILVNRRNDGENEYIFLTSLKGDTTITAVSNTSARLFAADSSNGEIYELPSLDGKYVFTLKSGKTVLLIHSDKLAYDLIPPYTDEIQVISVENKTEIPFVLACAGENILPLKNVNACFGKKAYRENNIDNLHKEFYALPDGEIVKVKYPFTVHKDKIGTVKVYIEYADNFDFAELNGKRIGSFTPAEKDPRFMGADITEFLADGKNTLAVEYKKYNNYMPDFSSLTPPHLHSFNPTTFEPVYLAGDFDADGDTLTQLGEYENDVTKSGMPHYYGSLTYQAKLPDTSLSDSLLTVCGSFDICKIKIGRREATYYAETPVAELFNLDAGTIVEITVFNTPYNLMRPADSEAKPFGIEKIEICK